MARLLIDPSGIVTMGVESVEDHKYVKKTKDKFTSGSESMVINYNVSQLYSTARNKNLKSNYSQPSNSAHNLTCDMCSLCT